jgi:TolB-like protein/class 3 adenylate cyclase/Flp pilus assembly protein TadD
MGLPRIERKLAAILAADVAGYSRLMGLDEEGTLAQLRAHRRALVDPKIKEHRGRIVKTTGDGMLVEFASVVDAVRCAVEVQRGMADRNAGVPQDKRIEFRIGINLGDIIVQDKDIFGDGVNVAARLEALAEPGGICVSRAACDQVRDKLGFSFEDIGEQSVKNIARPIHAYRVRFEGVEFAGATSRAEAPQRKHHAVWIAACVVLLVGVAGAGWYVTRPAIAPGAPRLSIIVLPFANVGHDSEQEYFANGITDDLTTDLSRIPGSFVIAGTTAFTYKGKAVDVKQIGRELGVRYVLEGSVRRTGEQVQINAQLIDAETGAHFWADHFDGERRDLPKLQSDITSRISRELIGTVARRIEQERRADPDAQDYIMRGRATYIRLASRENNQAARGFFERAIEIDGHSSDAMVGLAGVLVSNILDGWSISPDADKAHAEVLIRQALDLDPNSAEAHFVLGLLRKSQNRLEDALYALQTAISLDRNNTGALFQMGMVLTNLGQPQEAIPHIEKSIQLNPRSTGLATRLYALGYAHLMLGHVDEAIDLLRRARAENPGLSYVHLALAGALGLKGDIEEAKLELAEAIRLQPEFSTLKRIVAGVPYYANPKGWALRENTINLGLRNAGLPDE